MTTTISTKELSEQLVNPEPVVVDVRPAAAYNGWRLQREPRGGHIHGAVSFPLSWTKVVAGAELTTLLASKGIAPDKSVIVYGYGRGEGAAMASTLADSGFTRVATYDLFLSEWSADGTLPMARLANYEKLVHPEWIQGLISGLNPETYPGKGFVILDVSDDGFEEFQAGHIPTAVYLDTNAFEEEPLWNRVSDERLEGTLLALGITYEKTVVLYGRETAAAARVACMLMYAGVGDVRLLDGGFGAWTTAGYDVETETREPVPAQAFGRRIPALPEYIIDTQEVKALLADQETILVSVRSWAEYIGETSGYSHVKPRGRIAGAVWGHSGSDPNHMEDYSNIDNTMRSYLEIASNWRDAGINPDKRVIFYCGTGWRASQAFFCAHLMGWTNISVYDGGWLEWSLDQSNPVERGVPAGRN
jgi:thiosulfate/3-mercaptopyruvate sulfurtransferase